MDNFAGNKPSGRKRIMTTKTKPNTRYFQLFGLPNTLPELTHPALCIALAILGSAMLARPSIAIDPTNTPLIEPIRALQKAGVRVASIHPMFGPSIVLLRDADVVICDTGDTDATETVEKLFKPTTANIVRLPLVDHDRVMADLLSLAHATAIAFSLALPQSEHPVRSTTFLALETLAAAVVRESPDVYYEIQARNPFSGAAIERLRAAIDRVATAIASKDSTAFAQLMGEGQTRTPRTLRNL